MGDKALLTSSIEVGKLSGVPGTSDAQDAIASLVGQLFAGKGETAREQRALQIKDETFDAGAFETALADLQSDIVDRIRFGVLAYIRQRLLPVMEDAINQGADSLPRPDRIHPIEPGAAGRGPTNGAGLEVTERPMEPHSDPSAPPLFAEQARDDFWVSGEVAAVQPPMSSEQDGVYEGTVTLRVRAGLDVLNAMVQFVAELRGRPDLRLFKLMATTDKQETDIYVGLREPLHMRELLLKMDGVTHVDAPTARPPEGDEPLIHVELESSVVNCRA